MLALAGAMGSARAQAAGPAGSAVAQPLREALNADGTLRADVHGAFDPSGYQMVTAPDGRPSFRPTGPTNTTAVAGDWQPGFALAGTTRSVYAMTPGAGGKLYVGGVGAGVDTVVANGIAVWDGTAWSRLGQGVKGTVNTIAVVGSDVYVGGEFTRAGGAPARNVAHWNGTTWSALGAGVNGRVNGITVVGTNVYVGGAFTQAGGAPANHVARWDGTAWHSMQGGTDGTVYALAAIGPDVYVGGDFYYAGSNLVWNLARWTGTGWSAVGGGVDGKVRALLAVGTDLYVGGEIVSVLADTLGTTPGIGVSNLAKWTGTAWNTLGNGASPGPGTIVTAMTMLGTELHIAGTDGADNGQAEKWTGSRWQFMGSFNAYCYAIAAVGPELYLGGWLGLAYTTTLEEPINGIARWNGTAWRSFGPGLNDAVWAILISGTDVYIGGGFTQIGNLRVNGIAKWDGAAWHALGTGFTNSQRLFQRALERGEALVSALAIIGSDLYAAGSFETAGGAPANRIARWDGTSWSSLGAGCVGGNVHVMATVGADLYVGGSFSRAGGLVVNKIAKWNGTTWSALGAGTNNDVSALAVNGSTLYAGGKFTQAGGVAASRIAQWNGTAWSSLGVGTDQRVASLAVAGSSLYAGGFFNTAGGVPASRVARWDGTAWHAVATGLPFPVSALCVSGTKLYAGAGDLLSQPGRLSVWNDTTWQEITPNLDRGVWALATTSTELYVGGNFHMLRDTSMMSAFLGIYRPVGGTLRLLNFAPTSGPIGTTVTIFGMNLRGTTAVLFNGTPAPGFTVNAAGTQITVPVPPGTTTGAISLVSASGTVTSATSFQRTGPTGLSPSAASYLLALYPNPAHDELLLTVGPLPAGAAPAQLLDALGRVVRTTTVREGVTRLSLHGLTPGVYTVRLAGSHYRVVVN